MIGIMGCGPGPKIQPRMVCVRMWTYQPRKIWNRDKRPGGVVRLSENSDPVSLIGFGAMSARTPQHPTPIIDFGRRTDQPNRS